MNQEITEKTPLIHPFQPDVPVIGNYQSMYIGKVDVFFLTPYLINRTPSEYAWITPAFIINLQQPFNAIITRSDRNATLIF